MRRPSALWLGTAALTLLTLGWAAALVWALWNDMAVSERETLQSLLRPRLALVLLLALLLPALLALLLRRWWRRYPRAATRLRDGVATMATANAEHRVALSGAPEMRALCEAVNSFADVHSALRREVDTRVGDANTRLAQERTRLATLMSQLTQGVLVCNAEGRILLYNASAAALLEPDDDQADSAALAPLGLGRSIFGVLERDAVLHALEQVARRAEQRAAQPVAHFVTTRRRAGREGAATAQDPARLEPAPAQDLARPELAPAQNLARPELTPAPQGQLLRAQLALVQDEPGGSGGFVLTLEDITRSVEVEGRRDAVLQQLTEGTRSSLANLRAAVETLEQHPQMDAVLRTRFTAVVSQEAARLSNQVQAALHAGGDPLPRAWPREDILAGDLVFALRRSVEAGLKLATSFDGPESPLWLQLDSHAMVQALAHLLSCLSAALGVGEFEFALLDEGRHARLEMRWSGVPLEAGRLQEWAQQTFPLGADGRRVTPQQVLSGHGAELWSQADLATRRHRLCVQLPTAPAQPIRRAAPLHSRPVYYDFDLFHQAGQSSVLDDMPLAQLSCTVFDTETTGLAPQEGDEIISIGALRIVNARLLHQESFDRLICPRCALQPESQQIHGITAQMLAGQPTLEQVLPLFARFAQDTVLVAHNAAFDLRFLELARQRTGVKFEQPVLDTLLLSSLVHPGHHDQEHRLEHIAERLGVPVLGRHTALGDAIVTGEVFLKMLPLLAERGIKTLGQAREASRQSPYAKLAY